MNLHADATQEQFLKLLTAMKAALAAAEAVVNPYPEVAKLFAAVATERAAFVALAQEER